MSDTQIDAAADGAFSGKLADPSDTLTKRGGKGHVVYEGQEYDRLAWTRRCAALGYTLAAGEGAILNAALIEVEKERDALRNALQEIADRQVPGAFSRDHGEHAKNTLIATWEFAKAALAVQP